LLERIDEIVDSFESQFKSGNNPQIESFLEGWHDPELSTLLAELVGVEQEVRVRRGEKPTLSEYRSRFPRQHEVLDREFPASLGNYDLVELVGLGAFGRVYRGRLKGTNIYHALKILYERKSSSDLDLVVKEFQALAKIKHPAIVTAHNLDLGLSGGPPYLAMEFVEGKSLQEVLKSGRLPIGRVVRIVSEMAEALGAAHAAGIIHRDLKPANILMDPEWHPHLTDFGLALLNVQRHDRSDELAGTLAYIPPEHIRSEVSDPRSDIWSLGVILYEMLTGETPFHAANRSVLFEKIQKAQPTNPRVLRPDLSPELEQACLRCLEKDRNRRWSTAYDLIAALEDPSPVPPTRGVNRPLILGLAIALLVLTVPGGWYYFSLSHSSVSDSNIFFATQSDLDSDPSFRYANVRVTVRNGVVKLTGEVHQDSDRIRAAAIAGGEAGVRQVTNNLRVTPQIPTKRTSGQPFQVGNSIPKDSIQSLPPAASAKKTALLPSDWMSVNALQQVGNAIYLGGRGNNGGALAKFQMESGTIFDLSNLLPRPWCPVSALAYGANWLLVGGGSRGGCAGQFSPVSDRFEDMTSQLRAQGSDFYYYGGVGAVGFNGREFLIGGSGKRTSLEFFSAQTSRFSYLELGSYFAVNTIASDGSSFLVAGAGPGPGPQQPPAVGWISSTHIFTSLTGSLPPNWGTTRRAAYDGRDFLIQGFDGISGTNQLLALVDGSSKRVTDVTTLFPATLNVHTIDGHDGYFLIGGQLGQKAYLARYRSRSGLIVLMDQLPDSAFDVTAVKIVGDEMVAAGVNRAGQLFVVSFAADASPQ
jgi:serine/threonine protein kinase